MMETPNYVPKGSMCISCEYKELDCSHLPFEQMQVIRTVGNTHSVRCTEYIKEGNTE